MYLEDINEKIKALDERIKSVEMGNEETVARLQSELTECQLKNEWLQNQ